jgi:predicted membrane-bound spermidine synthase
VLLLSLVFFVSGAAALVFETLWFRQAGLSFGNSIWASSVVLASFMAGLAVGNGLAARFAASASRPLRVYALLEAFVGLTGLALVLGWPLLGSALVPAFRALAEAPMGLNTLRLGIAFALMLAPASAMGATLPVLACALGRRGSVFGQSLGLLYGLNTLGAVAGAIAGEVVLVRALGVRGAGVVAASLNALAALIVLVLARRDRAPVLPTPATVEESARRPRAGHLLAAAFLCGSAVLALEVVWFRFLSLFVANSSFAFTLLLAAVLLGIGIGGLLAALWLKLDPAAGRFLPSVLLLCGVLTVSGYAGFSQLSGLEVQTTGAIRILALALALTFPVCLGSGVSFTLLGNGAYPGPGGEAATAGRVTLANTLGALCGSAVGGFVLLPRLGVESSIVLLAGVFLVAGLLTKPLSGPATAKVAALASLALLAASLAAFPFGLMGRRYLPLVASRFAQDGAHAFAQREGLTETVVYMRRERPFEPPAFRLVVNGFSMSGTHLSADRYMSLYAWWPAAVHPGLRQVLLISYGCGTTARALVQLPGVERIDVVDTSRDILESSRLVHPPGADPLDDPRVHAHVEDGRQYLLTGDRRYDLITGEPPPPRVAGVANLYSAEYFRLLRARLAPRGIVTYWLPVEQLMPADTGAITKAFCLAFPDCTLWNGAGLNWMLVGTNDLRSAASESRFEGLWNDAAVGDGLRRIGVETPEQLGALFIDDAAGLRQRAGSTPALVDDFPYRILTPVGRTDVVGENVPFYRRWMDSGESRRRFLASDFVAEVWPASLRSRSAAFFEWQGLMNDAMIDQSAWLPPTTNGLPALDAVLTRSSLRTLALWLLGTNWSQQQTIAALAARGERYEELLGLRALAFRDYERAAESLARAGGLANEERRAYALALAGRAGEAARLTEANGEPAAAFRQWMKQRFGETQP